MIAKYEDPWAEYRRLIALVVRLPDHDGPRLRLARWLDRIGRDPPLAEFIRVDIAYWRAITNYSPSPPTGDLATKVMALGERRQVFLDRHSKRWSQPLLKILGLSDRDIVFRTRRGLVGSIIVAGGKAAQRSCCKGRQCCSTWHQLNRYASEATGNPTVNRFMSRGI